DPLGLRPVCGASRKPEDRGRQSEIPGWRFISVPAYRFALLPPDALLFRPRVDGQADVGDRAVRVAVARLLAVSEDGGFERRSIATRWLGAPGLGKSAVFSAGRRFEPGDLRSSKTGRRDVDFFRSAILGANGQCAGVLLALPGQILLALGSVGIL